jgi:hypothetical protein
MTARKRKLRKAFKRTRKSGPTAKAPSARPAKLPTTVPPKQVLPTLAKHMLVDGFDIVVDLRKSRGTYIVDAKDGK